jgi:thiamine biosynthesis lipoprotein
MEEIMKTKIAVLLILLISSMNLSGCTSNEYIAYSESVYALGTFVQITIYDNKEVDQEIFDGLVSRLNEIENKMTINIDVNSEVETINEQAGQGYVEVSEDTFDVIKKGVEYTIATEGRFDITVGPIVELWDIGFDGSEVPEEAAINEALPLLGIDKVSLNASTNEVMLEETGMVLDLGGIAKGYAADELKKMLVAYGYESAIIDLGGNIFCHGSKPDGTAFKVGIRDPFGSSSDYLGVLSINNQTVVTSGIYERYFIQEGVTYHHIIDTATGYPVDNELESVSIVASQSVDADALSTGVFSMGVEEGYAFVSDLEDVEAIFVTSEGDVIVTDGLQDSFVVTSDDFNLVSIEVYE